MNWNTISHFAVAVEYWKSEASWCSNVKLMRSKNFDRKIEIVLIKSASFNARMHSIVWSNVKAKFATSLIE